MERVIAEPNSRKAAAVRRSVTRNTCTAPVVGKSVVRQGWDI
jgi:hypothetical protein